MFAIKIIITTLNAIFIFALLGATRTTKDRRVQWLECVLATLLTASSALMFMEV